MECRLCGHPSPHKHGKAPNGSQRYFCPQCKQTFNERFDQAQLVHKVEVQAVQTEEVSGDELWSLVEKTRSNAAWGNSRQGIAGSPSV